jgi:hypothetical protein
LGPCWIWQGSRTGSLGYGQFTINAYGTQRHVGAHRYAYELTHGPVADGLEVMHKCDNPICVRPDHLGIGTHTQNVRDAADKGRLRVPRPRAQKLTDAQLLEIPELRRSGLTLQAIADRFGVSKTLISLLLAGKRRQYSNQPQAIEKAS